jgi:hypothetical protein
MGCHCGGVRIHVPSVLQWVTIHGSTVKFIEKSYGYLVDPRPKIVILLPDFPNGRPT